MSRTTHRQLLKSDIPALVALVNSAYRGDSSKKGWTTEADLLGGQRIDPEKAEEILRNPDQVVWVWPEGDSSLMACVLLERKSDRAYLGMLTVSPTLQNSGMARQILQVAETWVQNNWLLSTIEMTVIGSRQELISWYQRRGYQLTGESRPFPMHDERFGLPKVSQLEFIVLEKNCEKIRLKRQ